MQQEAHLELCSLRKRGTTTSLSLSAHSVRTKWDKANVCKGEKSVIFLTAKLHPYLYQDILQCGTYGNKRWHIAESNLTEPATFTSLMKVTITRGADVVL